MPTENKSIFIQWSDIQVKKKTTLQLYAATCNILTDKQKCILRFHSHAVQEIYFLSFKFKIKFAVSTLSLNSYLKTNNNYSIRAGSD